MLRMVLLRHVDDRGWHYDWMIEQCAGDDPEERVLMTFRVGVHPGESPGGRFIATRIGDHRRAYLTRTGDLGGGRGSVERVAAGSVTRLDDAGLSVEVEGRFDGGHRFRWRGEQRTEDEWEFVARVLA